MAPGGRGGDPAITWNGVTLTYREFADRIESFPAPPSGLADPGSADPGSTDRIDPAATAGPRAGPDLPDVLAAMFAAASRGFAVLVGHPGAAVTGSSARGWLPQVGPLPSGTWLVATTSGTAGRPRAVCRTAASWVESFGPLTTVTGLSAQDSVLVPGPLTATMHLFAAVHTLAIGAHLTDRAGQATAVHAVPQRLAALLDVLPTTAPLRTAVVAGSALPDVLATRCLERGVAVTEYYGAAELSFVAARRVPGPMRRFPGVDVRIDGDGVLWARSPYLAIGYAGDRPGPLQQDPDGFATVGDLAGIGTDGALTIRGRGDAAINTGGHTVLAEDVEAVLGALPGVAGVAVVGVGHPRFGQIVVAVLEPAIASDGAPSQAAPGRPVDLAGAPAAARARLVGPSRPRRYLVCDRLPRTPGGKISRAAVVAGLADGSLPTRPLR